MPDMAKVILLRIGIMSFVIAMLAAIIFFGTHSTSESIAAERQALGSQVRRYSLMGFSFMQAWDDPERPVTCYFIHYNGLSCVRVER